VRRRLCGIHFWRCFFEFVCHSPVRRREKRFSIRQLRLYLPQGFNIFADIAKFIGIPVVYAKYFLSPRRKEGSISIFPSIGIYIAC
jgi:hypothetical protein